MDRGFILRVSDKRLMENLEKSWIKALNLNPDDFTSCPQGENPLFWAFESQLIEESDYMEWASETHQIPTLQSQFFELGWDRTLSTKHHDIFHWEKDCFPIYQWNDILYVACLEPQNISTSMQVCFVVASPAQMSKAWAELEGQQKETLSTEIELGAITPVEEPKTEEPLSQKTQPPVFKELESPLDKPLEPPPVQRGGTNEDQLPDIDFRFLQSEGAESAPLPERPPAEAQNQELASDSEVVAEKNIPKPPPLDLEALSFSSLQVGDPEAENVPAFPQKSVLPSKGDNREAPPLEASALPPLPPPLPGDGATVAPTATPVPPVVSGEPTSTPSLMEAFDDDKTPPPEPAVPSRPTEGTPAAIPFSNAPRVNTASLEKLGNPKPLEETQSLSDSVYFIFSRMQNDFEKLMWIPKVKDKGFIPKLVHGPWSPAPSTWSAPVDIKSPNIFKIPWATKRPFHGAISENEINRNYFASWDRGKIPAHITIFPFYGEGKKCVGFLVGSGNGPDFHLKKTLKKMEQTVALVEKQMNSKTKQRKAG